MLSQLRFCCQLVCMASCRALCATLASSHGWDLRQFLLWIYMRPAVTRDNHGIEAMAARASRHLAVWLRTMCFAGVWLLVALPWPWATGTPQPAYAQPSGGWSTDLDISRIPAPEGVPQPNPLSPNEGAGTTVLKKKTAEPPVTAGMSKVRLIALLTADGQRIEQDLVWRVFAESSEPRATGKLISTQTAAAPVLTLQPGTYVVNVAFGRANLTRKITVAEGIEATEPFVLNAGGLRVRLAPVAGGIEGMKALYEILTDERDQSGDRRVVLSRAKPGTVIRLNSGIYHIVSTLGDANATVSADVTVEAGKLTEASISHKAGRVTFKLVTRHGGEALPDTEWTVLTDSGQTIKSSVGALPTHILAPGRYMAVAKSQGGVFRRSFDIADGQSIQVEVMRQ